MSSSPTRDALATILDALASQLETLELVMKDLGARNVPAVDVRAAFSNVDEHPRALLPLTHDFVIFHHFTSSSCAHLP